jgi:hypothetical protein
VDLPSFGPKSTTGSNVFSAMVAALKAQGTPVWYLAAKDEGHGFVKKKNADFQFYATALFVEKYLLGERAATANGK